MPALDLFFTLLDQIAFVLDGAATALRVYQLLKLNRLRQLPRGLKNDGRKVARENRSLRRVFANDDAFFKRDGTILNKLDRERRQVDKQVRLAKIVRHPTPLFHVGTDRFQFVFGTSVQRLSGLQPNDAIGPEIFCVLKFFERSFECIVEEFGVLAARRNGEAAAQNGNVGMSLSWQEERAGFRHTTISVRRLVPCAQRLKDRLQFAELLVLGMERSQYPVRISRCCDLA